MKKSIQNNKSFEQFNVSSAQASNSQIQISQNIESSEDKDIKQIETQGGQKKDQNPNKNLWREIMSINTKQLKQINDANFTNFVRKMKYSRRELDIIIQYSKNSQDILTRELAQKYIVNMLNPNKFSKILLKRKHSPEDLKWVTIYLQTLFKILVED
ncbi:hypothetical protein ABPG72_021146 [Tetrahymena utriculariae]